MNATMTGSRRCESCDKEFDRPLYRYILNTNVSDHTGSLWMTCFDDAGKLVIGKSADEMMDLKDAGDDAAYRAALENANCRTWVFRCRAKMDTYMEQQRYGRSRVELFLKRLTRATECATTS